MRDLHEIRSVLGPDAPQWLVDSCRSVEDAREHVRLMRRERSTNTDAVVEPLSRTRSPSRGATPARPSAGSASSAPSTVAATRTVRLSDVLPEQVQWLWDGRIPRGMLTLVDGDPGLGKSTATLDIAARVTTGARMPFDRQPPAQAADVILMTAEDHLGATIRPRLDAARADTHRVHAIVAMPQPGDPDAPATLAPNDILRLEEVIVAHHAGLVIVDPLMAYLPSDVDSHRDQDVRRVLRVLAAVAERTGAAIVIVRHLRKGGGSAMYRGAGAVGITGAARSVMLVAPDPEDDDARMIAATKSNLGVLAPTLRWRLVDAGGVARVEWVEIAHGVTADQLAADNVGCDKERETLQPIMDAIVQVLSDGPRSTTDVEREVRALCNTSPRTIERARAKLGIVASRSSGKDGRARGWVLSLPVRQQPGGGGGLAADGSEDAGEGIHQTAAANMEGDL